MQVGNDLLIIHIDKYGAICREQAFTLYRDSSRGGRAFNIFLLLNSPWVWFLFRRGRGVPSLHTLSPKFKLMLFNIFIQYFEYNIFLRVAF